MKVAFYYECGPIVEIGMGHLYRVNEIKNELVKRGHKVEDVKDDMLYSDINVLIVDHLFSQKKLIKRATAAGIKTVLIDGCEDDAGLVSESISATYNPKSKFSGIKYMCFPTTGRTNFYSNEKKSNCVFVAMGGFDKNNIAEVVVNILNEVGLKAIVAKSINHNFNYGNMEFYIGNNYYDPMNECCIAITNGGLSLFQALHYGMPTIAIPQYEHQLKNISLVKDCCVECVNDRSNIKNNIVGLINNGYKKTMLSFFGSYMVDGKACKRICDIIEGLK